MARIGGIEQRGKYSPRRDPPDDAAHLLWGAADPASGLACVHRGFATEGHRGYASGVERQPEAANASPGPRRAVGAPPTPGERRGYAAGRPGAGSPGGARESAPGARPAT